jgi:hypothetical protein
MLLRTSILACLLMLLARTVTARAAEESSSEDAPFASTNKGPAPFAASPSAGFAAMGQWVLSLRTTPDGGGFAFFHKSSPGDWEISLHPSLDYFITSNISVGGTFGYFHSPAATGTTILDIGARAGFNLTINDHFGIWPTAGIAGRIASANHETNSSSLLGVFAPILYHPVPHLFVGLGPSFSLQLSGGDGRIYGVDFVLGGWL